MSEFVFHNEAEIDTQPQISMPMANGGDINLEAFKRNNSIVEPPKMFFGGVIERVARQAREAAARGDSNKEKLAAFNDMYGPSASEAAGFNPVATMAGGFDDLPIRVQEQLGADLGDVAERVGVGSTGKETQEEYEARQRKNREEAAAADRAESAEHLQFQLEGGVAFDHRGTRYVDALTPDEIQRLILGKYDGFNTKLTAEQATLLTQNYEISDDQIAELFAQGLLTEDQVRAIVEQEVEDEDEEEEEEVEDAETGSGLTQEEIQKLIDESGLTEEQIQQLITDEFKNFNPDVDLTGYLTADGLTPLDKRVTGLETLFQNALTPEQLNAYMAEGSYVTADQLAAATSNEYDTTIQQLQDQVDLLEERYPDVTSQYEADAVNQQIADTKDEIDTYYRAAIPTGPRTGSTSQFDAGLSYFPGGSPMAKLIEGQRAGQGQDPFRSYLRTFTPSYGEYNEPFSPQEYNERNLPFTDGMYNNPFTGGISYSPDKQNMGGQVSNGIMDLTNFDTNVQPFQNAFRPNVPRN